MLVWLIQEDGTFVDEMNTDNVPKVGETITSDRAYQVVAAPEQDENARKFNAQVLVVKEA